MSKEKKTSDEPKKSNEAISDRFTTHWTGPLDDRAQDWASAHNINFSNSGFGFQIHRGPGMLVTGIGPSSLTLQGLYPIANLREENLKSDQETRALHARDTGLDTGSADDLGYSIDFPDRTRGQKLRYCKMQIEACEEDYIGTQKLEEEMLGLDEEGQRKRLGEMEADPEHVMLKVEGPREYLECLAEIKSCQKGMIETIRELKGLVEKEVEEGWDWKIGIEEQRVLWKKLVDFMLEGERQGKWLTWMT